MKAFRKFSLAMWAFLLFLIAPVYAEIYFLLLHTWVDAAYPMILETFGFGVSFVLLNIAVMQPSYLIPYGGINDLYANVMYLYYLVGFVLSIVFWRRSVKKKKEKYNLISGFISLGYCLFSIPYCIYYLFGTKGGAWTKIYFGVFLALLFILVVFTILKFIALQREKKASGEINLSVENLQSEEEKD